MPVMLPYDIGYDTFTSDGERKVFEYFRDSRIPGYAIHSLGFEQYGEHEIDYVVICERGILCLEVKGGGITREGGEWIYTDHRGIRHKGQSPYDQANENMHMLREKFRSHFKAGEISDVQFSWGVVLPDAPMRSQGADIPLHRTFDKTMGLDRFDDFMLGCFDTDAEYCLRRNGVAGTLLGNKKDLEAVKDYLRGDFGYIPDLNSQLEGVEGRLNRATEQQYRILRSLGKVDRILINGGAGTGKTMLAVEHARRLAAAGRKVLFLTFNKQINLHLAKNSPIEGVSYYNFSDFLYKSTYPNNERVVTDEEKNEFYRKELPETFYNEGGLPDSEKYDALIVDEAQDILDDTRICCLDMMLKGGLARGSAAFFYDANQNIFNPKDAPTLERAVDSLLDGYGFVPFELLDNCRSTRRISDFSAKATGITQDNFSHVDGSKVSVIPYENLEQQRKLLAATVAGLLKEGIPAEDIVVISHIGNTNEKGCFYDLSNLQKVCRHQYLGGNKMVEPMKGMLRVTTIQSFKGMEAKVVIVADVYRTDDDRGFIRPLNYTAFSRAKSQLLVLAHKDVKKDLVRIVSDVG